MKKAAIFDMDGTLVANSPVHIRAFEIFCARYDVTDWREKLANGFGMGNDDIMRLVTVSYTHLTLPTKLAV